MSTEKRPPIITESRFAFLDETTPKPINLQGMGTWRDQLEVALRLNGESLADVVSTTFTTQQLDHGFYGAYEAFMPPFFAWTSEHVYFCNCKNGDELIYSVPRNPLREE